jgi:tRNA pseudouridine38-40 synthase
MVRALKIAYRGTAYAGWQRQPNAVTVQQVLEEAIERLAGETLPVTGASRTDAGVHARGQVAHLVGADSLPDRALVHGTNRYLPEDVRVLAARSVGETFHARKSAMRKLYSYRVVRTDVLSPLEALFAVRADRAIDVEAMGLASTALVGEHDFSAFALAGGSHLSPRRTIFSAEWREKGDEIVFLVEGNGFLRGMVRSIVGTLLEVGSGRRQPTSIGGLLEGGPRGAAGPTAPPQGLTLERVDYKASRGGGPRAW